MNELKTLDDMVDEYKHIDNSKLLKEHNEVTIQYLQDGKLVISVDGFPSKIATMEEWEKQGWVTHSRSSMVSVDKLKYEAKNHIKSVSIGNMPDRNLIPMSMRGKIAKSLWNDEKFTYGMEYEYILAMMYYFNLAENDLK